MSAEQQQQRTGWKRSEKVAWALVAAFVVWIQWPMLKGTYYRATGAGAPAATIAWRTDLDMALAESRATGKRVLVDFTADWCPPCIVMKHDVWPDARVAAMIEKDFVPLLVDMDRDTQVSARYEVEAIPTIMVLDGDGRVLARQGYLPVSGMERLLREQAPARGN